MPGDILGEATLVLKATNKRLNNDIARAKKGSTGLQTHFAGVAASIKTAFAGIGVGLIARQVLAASIEQERVERLLENAVRSTGMAAGFTAEQLKRQASALQEITVIGDEAIIDLQIRMLAFSNITGAVFERTQGLIIDFAQATGRNAADAAKTLGLAINDPLVGMGRLSQAGISLSVALRDNVKKLVNSGRTMDAQNLLLDELQKSYGGAAVAARNTLGGALTSLQNKFGDLFFEMKGPGVTAVTTFIDLLTKNMEVALSKSTSLLRLLTVQFTFLGEVMIKVGAATRQALKGDLEEARETMKTIPGILIGLKGHFDNLTGAATNAGVAIAGLDVGVDSALFAADRLGVGITGKITGPMVKLSESFKATFAQFGRSMDNARSEIDRQADAIVESLRKIDQEMQQIQDQGAASIGGLTAQLAKGELSFEKFGQKVALEIGKMVAKFALLEIFNIGGGGFFGSLIGGFADGGRPPVGVPSLVGEGGPELFVPDMAGTIIPAQDTAALGGGGVSIEQNFTLSGFDISSSDQIRKVAAALTREIKAGATEAINMSRATSDSALGNSRRAV